MDNNRARASMLALDAGGGYFGYFFLSPIISFFSPSVTETAR